MTTTRQFIWLYFGFGGRINRHAYFLGLMLLTCLMVPAVMRAIGDDIKSLEQLLNEDWFLLMAWLSAWPRVALASKRFRDFDWPGVCGLLLFVPVVGFIAIWALFFVPGTPGPNRFGVRTNEPL